MADSRDYAGGDILALDAAKSTGICQGEPGTAPVLETIDFSCGGGSDFDIWGRAMRWMARRISATIEAGRRIGLVILEGLVPKYDKTLQCGLYAALGGVARNAGIRVMTVMPMTWRASVLGDGKLNRKAAKTRAVWLMSQLGWTPQGDDDAEAGCIWIWGVMQLLPRLAPRLPLFMRGASWQ